ncbi:hypothetical protein I3843_04G043700 [Carya illinoinensis]|uniref:Uncharacterized protein n=1 Tax=Carya illinoinensis TaxID=32201 RepID=A0A8T1QQM0_CARIL|nr:transcription factor MYB8-like [Carya illinoinensis]KAG6656787.1 hypothetical protein CIPAW_04G046000 [Carya illinoinensis]KAG7982296.1 hypothetical protein I3843_04G043700 [Carya illinoinensis]
MRKPCSNKEGNNNKGAWSKQEDQKLIDYIRTHGEGSWSSLPKAAGLDRCGKSCRLRWINYLRPDIKRGNFGQDEEDLIIKLHALLGNRWSLIAGRLPGRTDNEVKNYWNSHIRRKLISMGIDPNNHKLNQQINPPRPQPESVNVVSAAATTSLVVSSESTNYDHDCKPPQLKSIGNADHRVSEGTASSSVDQDEMLAGNSLALNLDLTIAFPSPVTGQLVQEKRQSSISMSTKQVEREPVLVPTLLLF